MASKTLSFRGRLVLYFTSTILVLTACFYLLVTYFAEKSLDQQLQRTRASINRLLQAEIASREKIAQQYVEGVRSNVRFKAALAELNHGGDVELLRQTLLSNFRPKDFTVPPTLLSIADSEGNIQARFLAPDTVDAREFKNLSGADLYEFLEQYTTAVKGSSVVESAITKAVVVAPGERAHMAYLPVGESAIYLVVSQKILFDDGEKVGAVVLGSVLDESLIQSFRKSLDTEDQIALVSQGGVQHSSSGSFRDFLLNRKTDLQQRVEQGGKTFGVLEVPLLPAFGTDGKSIAEAPYIAFALDFSSEVRSQGELLRLILFIGLFGVLGSLLIAYALARSMAKPIKKLVAGTQKIARGQYPVVVAIDSEDEFGLLADSFNEMSQGLELKDRYRNLMDMVVSPEIANQLRTQEQAGTLNLGGDTQRVTILFADVRGFTPLSQERSPQEVLEMLNEYFEIASSVIEDHGGVIDKFIGDEVMSLFGAPLEKADDAERAVKAALALRDSMTELNQNREDNGEPSLLIGIGLATGDVVAGLMGSRKRLSYSVIGPAVNLAARLCGAAQPLEVLVSKELVTDEESLIFEKKEGVELKGISREVSVFAVRSAL